MVEALPPKEKLVEATLRLACNHLVEIAYPLKEYYLLAEEIEERNPQGRTAWCGQCDGYSVITCIYAVRSITDT